MSTDNIYKANKDEAAQFLKALVGVDDISAYHFTFQIFDDKKPPRSILARQFSGTLEEYWSELLSANESGCGVFVMVNEGDLQGRKNENVKAIRALFVDLDGSPLEPVLNSVIKPNVIVESSKGRYHAYWLVKDCKKAEFSKLQKSLAKKFNADEGVCDLPRVMRIPGFLHQKAGVFLSSIISDTHQTSYTVSELTKKLELSFKTKEDAAAKTTNAKTTISIDEIRKMLSVILSDDYQIWRDIGFSIHSQYPNREGLNLYDEWSKKSSKYKGYDDVKSQWDSIDNNYHGKKIEIGTLIRLAKENGYQKEEPAKKESKTKQKQRTYQEYIDFVYDLPIISEIKLDALSNELLAITKDNQRMPIENLLEYIQSHAVEADGFKLTNFARHLSRHKHEDTKPELLIHIPEWDKKDRLRDICDVVKVKDFDKAELYELLLSWGSTIFRRLADASIQPPTIILKGAQGCGKDTLVNALVGGLGDYQKELNLSHGKDAEAQLHTALVFRISEFDKTAKFNVAQLKHLLTTDKTNCRLSYDRRAETRDIRASFIATCNVEDMLRDTSGNRRYWVLDVEYAGFKNSNTIPNERARFDTKPEKTYPGMFCRENFRFEQKQILAQFKEMSELGDYKPSQNTLDKMCEKINRLTPSDPLEDAISLFDEYVNYVLSKEDEAWHAQKRKKIAERGWITNSEIPDFELFEKISQATSLREKDIRSALKRANRERRDARDRGFAFKQLPQKTASNRFSGIQFNDQGDNSDDVSCQEY